MNILRYAFYEVIWYGIPIWCGFIALAFCSARYLRWTGVILYPFILAVMIYLLDTMWIFDDMKNHPENGRDADFVFLLGVLLRIVLFNILLLPVGAVGLWSASRKRARAG